LLAQGFDAFKGFQVNKEPLEELSKYFMKQVKQAVYRPHRNLSVHPNYFFSNDVLIVPKTWFG
jgi:hypothetical protein